MKVLIDIGHPGHVHLYKNILYTLKNNGHIVFVTTQNVSITKDLLTSYFIPFKIIGSKKDKLVSKAFGLLSNTFKLISIIKKNKINFCLGSTPSLVQASYFTRIPSVFLDDDDDVVEPFVKNFAHPFTSVILSPNGTGRKSKKVIYYKGYHELTYLHPNVFTPNPEVLKEVGLDNNDFFSILRFVALKGHHDINSKGLNLEQKLELVKILEKKGKVFITGERNLEVPLKKYSLSISPEKLHDLLAYARIFIGDSQTMASEAAVLGIPSLRCNTFVGKIAYLEDEEHNYGLTFGFTPDRFGVLKQKMVEIIENPHIKVAWQRKKEKMLKDKIDVTAFLVWFIENYPQSVKIMRENPDYQLRFK